MSNTSLFRHTGEIRAATPIVFLPGWGFDGGVARLANLPAGTVVPRAILDPDTAAAALLAFLDREGIKKIHLHGWSMGANIALDFAAAWPERIASLTLLSLRRNWPRDETTAFLTEYRRDPAALFEKFCRRTFAGAAAAAARFKEEFMAATLESHNLNILEKGLEYLCGHEPEEIGAACANKKIPVRQFHGKKDLVAPAAEMAEIPGAQTVILPRMGHAVFLAPEYGRLPELAKCRLACRFSRAADSYDAHADIQKEARDMLAAMLPAGNRKKILELGCGTGALSAELKRRYPGARITLVELSHKMLELAVRRCQGGVEAVCGDAESFLDECGGSFDLIVSAAALHWFDDPGRAVANCGRLLAADGLFIASLFGPQTLAGLGQALAACGGPEIAATRFPAREDLEAMLEQTFTRHSLRETVLERQYPSTLDLLRQLKKTGTGGGVRARLTPAMVRRVERWFLAKHGSVQDVFQVFFVRGKR